MKFLRKEGDGKFFLTLWILCIIGSWFIIPTIHFLGVVPFQSLGKVFLILTTVIAILYGLICWLSSKILPRTDLHPFQFQNPFKRILCPAIISGVLISLIIFFVDKSVFHSSLRSIVPPPVWAATLGAAYRGINHEVFLRLFLFSLFYFLLGKIAGVNRKNRIFLLWGANIIVASVFGLVHFPAAFRYVAPSAFEISRVLFINGIAGLVFGWLYWSRGIWAAIVAHFVSDFVMNVILIAPVLGISVSDIQLTHMKPQIVSTGLRDIFVPVVTQECLFALRPHFEQITKLSEKYGAIGLHVFSLESSKRTTTAFCRNFAPRYGIPEESATGSSNGALGCYLFQTFQL